MRQAWHIFRKDLFGLRQELAIYLGTLVACWWYAEFQAAITEALVTLAGAYLIARLIQADAPAGNRQFWITRPYRWSSLLAAKLLFIIALVDLPILFAQWLFLAREAFSFSSVWKGLLWEQVLIFGVSLLLAALAALTPGPVAFMAAALGIAATMVGTSIAAARPAGSLYSFEWVRESVGFIVALAVSAVVIYLQYKKRDTARNRQVAFLLAAAGIAAYIFVPLSLAFAIQQRFSKQPFDPSSLHISLNSDDPRWGLAMLRGKQVQIAVPMVLAGLPAAELAKLEALNITLTAPDGRQSRLQPAKFLGLKRAASGSSGFTLTANSQLDRDFFDAERDHPVTLRGALYLTLFGNIRSYSTSVGNLVRTVDLTDRLRCFIAQNGLFCTSPFRRPAERADMYIGVRSPPAEAISYSPFPATLRFFPFERQFGQPPPRYAYVETANVPLRDVVVTISDPVSYVRRDFEIPDVRLTDIAVPWRSQQVTRDGKSLLENEY